MLSSNEALKELISHTLYINMINLLSSPVILH